MKVTIEKIISSGDGLGWADGKTWFAPFTVPGETIDVVSSHKEKSYQRVDSFKLIKPSMLRREPSCPLYGRCGGCNLQHINYDAQLSFKKDILKELFVQKQLSVPQNITVSGVEEFGFRTRAKVWFVDGKAGFRRRSSHEHVPFESCPLLYDKLNDVIRRSGKRYKHKDVQFEYSVSSDRFIPADKLITRKVLGKDIVMSRGSFFQSSEIGAELLVEKFLSVFDRVNPDTVLDLFCGIGLFSLFAADRGSEVTGMEIAASSVSDFRRNLGRRGKIVQADVTKISSTASYDLIVIDPPRSGLGKKAVDVLVKGQSNHIVYVSCNASTFVRDYELLEKAGFVIEKIELIDLFPNTNHFELFVHLSR